MKAEPWLENEAWNKGVVRSGAGKSTRFLWFFAIFWNLVSLPVCVVLPAEIGKGNYAVLLVLLFPLVGAGIGVWAWRSMREWKYFGVTELHLDPFPGSIGGQVGGSIDINRPFEDPEFEVTLQSVWSYISGSGKNRSRREDIKWQVRGKPEINTTPRGVRLMFCFDVPGELNQTQEPASSYWFWRLQLKDKNKSTRIRLDRSFELPVFKTGKKAEHVKVNTGAASRQEMRAKLNGSASDLSALEEEHGLILDRRGEWLRLYFPVGRKKIMASSLFVMGVLFGGAGVFLGFEGETLMSTVFSVFGLVLLFIGLYLPFNSLDVRISPARIFTERRWMGVRLLQKAFAPSQVTSVKITQSSSTTSTSGTIIRYKISARLRECRPATLAEGIVGQMAADALRETILEAAGLRQK